MSVPVPPTLGQYCTLLQARPSPCGPAFVLLEEKVEVSRPGGAAPDGRCLYPVLADRLAPVNESPNTFSFEAISHRRVRGPDPNTRALRKSLKSYTPAQVATARVKAVTAYLPGQEHDGSLPCYKVTWLRMACEPVTLAQCPEHNPPVLFLKLHTAPCTPVPQFSVNPLCCCGPSPLLSSLSLFCACCVRMYDTHLGTCRYLLHAYSCSWLQTLIPRHAVCPATLQWCLRYLPKVLSPSPAGPIPLTRRSPHLGPYYVPTYLLYHVYLPTYLTYCPKHLHLPRRRLVLFCFILARPPVVHPRFLVVCISTLTPSPFPQTLPNLTPPPGQSSPFT